MKPRYSTSCHPMMPWVILFALTLAGCGKKESDATPNVTDDPPIPIESLESSFAALAAKEDLANEVRWDVALVLAEISNIAYATDAEQIERLQELGAVKVKPLTQGSSEGVVASDKRSVVIAFRGTQERPDFLIDIKIFGRRTPEGRIHRGFLASVDALYDLAIAEALRQGAREKTVWITGHSLGGAMAMVFAHRSTVRHTLRPDGVVTFGQPLAVDTAICQYMLDEFQGNYVRFVNQWDPVTRMLPNYRHAGARVHLNGGEFSLRKPMIAVSAPPGQARSQLPPVEFFEDQNALQPMTEEEFAKFERALAVENNSPAANEGVVVRASVPILSDHSMDNYIESLRAIGSRNFKRSVGAAP